MHPILLLSPHQSIADLMPVIADEFGVAVAIEVADDATAVAAVLRHPTVEVVVTRGGLAERIRPLPGISVVEIVMSLNELLGNLGELTARGNKRIAIVSNANLLGGAAGDFRILDVEVSIRPQVDEAAIRAMVAQCVGEGFGAIVGCRVAFETAQQLGVDAVFLDSSVASIRTALREASRILEAKRREKLQAAQLAAIIDNIDEAVIVVTPRNEIGFYNRHARRICTSGAASAPDFAGALAVLDGDDKEAVTTINGNSVIARSIPLLIDDRAQGRVLTLHEVSRIHASETKIRASLYQKGLYARHTFSDVIGASPLIHEVIARARIYAAHDANLLIYGETGTGKEVFAQSIHSASPRSRGPFVSVNTASIPPSLLESELFGYVEGAFTGARKGGKPGLFELAHRGTLFLDEIGELAPEIQSRLLRVLQEKEIMRIGDDKIIPVDVRIVSATNRDLFQQTLSGAFRQDLYYRIHVVGLRIPPLRARAEDIPVIFEHYLRQFRGRSGARVVVTQAAKDLLQACPWPGNIRQLRNIAEVVSYGDTDTIGDREIAVVLGEQERTVTEAGFITIPEGGSLKTMEAGILRHLLSRYRPDEVCARLGISRVTLWRKMKNLAIAAPAG